MKKMSAVFAVSAGLFLSGAVEAAEIDLQRNTPAIIDGVLYPVSGRALVMPDMESVLAAFPTTQSELNAVANLTERSVVNVIVIDPMLTGNLDALTHAKDDNRRDVDRLQAAITANNELKTELEARSVLVATVFAADLAPNGVLVLYALA
jgi:hypothetical protein